MFLPGFSGATSVLASITPEVRQLGWSLLPIVIISSLLMMSVALIVNNIERQYPLYWIRAPDEAAGAAEKKSVATSGFGTIISRAWLSETTPSSLTVPEKAYILPV